MTPEKIFILGLPRTGTTSVCHALLTLGYRVAHTAYTQQTFEQAQVLADTPIFNDYKLIDEHYPNSKFILLTRELSLWLPSIKQLLNRMATNLLRNDGGFNPHIKRCYLETFAPFTTENIISDKFLTACYQKHWQDVQDYFKTRPEQLLTIDVSQPNDYQSLCQFLKLPIHEGQFKQLNIGGKVTAWKDIKSTNKVASTRNGKASKLAYLSEKAD